MSDCWATFVGTVIGCVSGPLIALTLMSLARRRRR